MTYADANDVAADLSRYLKKVQEGETIIIAIHDRPVAELRPTFPESSSPRPFGLAVGEFTVPDDFDAPLSPEIIADFEGA